MARLPDDPDLGWLRKAAKRLHREHPERRLNEAQRDLARHFEFPSWPALKRHVELVRSYRRAPDEVPEQADPAHEFLRLACLTYRVDDPDRRRRAAALGARVPTGDDVLRRGRPRRHGRAAPPPRRGPPEGDARGRALPVAAARLPRVRPARPRAQRGRHPRGSAPPPRPRRRPRHGLPLARAAVAVHRPHRVLRRGRGRAGRPATAPPRLRPGAPPPRARRRPERQPDPVQPRFPPRRPAPRAAPRVRARHGRRRPVEATARSGRDVPRPRCCSASWAGPSCAGWRRASSCSSPTAPMPRHRSRCTGSGPPPRTPPPSPRASRTVAAVLERLGAAQGDVRPEDRTVAAVLAGEAGRRGRRPRRRASTGRASSRGPPSTATTWACGPRSHSAGTSTGWPGPTSPPTSPGRAPSTPRPPTATCPPSSPAPRARGRPRRHGCPVRGHPAAVGRAPWATPSSPRSSPTGRADRVSRRRPAGSSRTCT